jgi:hypothetical protein
VRRSTIVESPLHALPSPEIAITPSPRFINL